jgi:hypothetical protein
VEATDLATAVLKAGAVEARALMVNNPVTKAGVHHNKVCKDSKTGMDLRKTRNGEAETKANLKIKATAQPKEIMVQE